MPVRRPRRSEPAFDVGPVPIETLVFVKDGTRFTVVAKPEAALRLPLELRHGVLKRYGEPEGE